MTSSISNYFCLFLAFCCCPFWLNAQCEATTADEFFDCYGAASFNEHSTAAVTAFIQAENAIQLGDYAQAQQLVQSLFATYPKGSTMWWNVFNAPNGANLGTPHAYYGLRMIEDITDYHLNPPSEVAVRTANVKIVLVGCSQGIQPTTQAELENGSGPFITNELNENLSADDYRIIWQSFDFFSRYVTAITGGELELNVEIIELPEVCMDVGVTTNPGNASGSIAPIWDALSDEIKDDTDWWWVLYPSHVPEFPDFEDDAFITGGMGADSKGGPAFIIDDEWLVRKPAHLGQGDYTDIERRIYLPQWLQHEFFHHLYRIYPEFSLEVAGHDWFNLDFWPDDFIGRFEADYYAETLHKRLQMACVSLSDRLITRIDNELAQEALAGLSMEELIGPYSLDNIGNAWHEGELQQQGGQYFWRNSANVQWQVTPELAEGLLVTGPENPYPGQDFLLELYQTPAGEYLPAVVALKFQGDVYRKRFNMIRDLYPLEIVLGAYQRAPSTTAEHSGSIIKEDGQYYWENDAGDRWQLSYDAITESFLLEEDSPTPNESLQLVLAEGECDIEVLGFNYLGDFYPRNVDGPVANEEMNPLVAISLSPNPAHDYFLLTGLSAAVEISIFSMGGQHQQTMTATAEQLRIDVSSLPAGVYWLRVLDRTNNTTVLKKVVVY